MFCGIILFLFMHEIQTNAVKLASNYKQDYHYTGYEGVDEEICKSLFPQMCSKGVDEEICKSLFPQMCSKGVDEEICKSLFLRMGSKGVDEEICKSLFPQMGSKGVDEEICKSLFPQMGSKDKVTVKGGKCIFPFSYRGVKYNDCAPGVSIDQPSPWCAISTNDDYSNTVKNWDICVHDESRLTVKGTRCIFPFIYRGSTYTDCAPGVSQPTPWCATLLQDNHEPKDWDVCVPDTRTDDMVCKSLTKDSCKSKPIMELCPQMCSEGTDDKVCKSLIKDSCKSKPIMELCPQMCSEESDDELCELLDEEECRKNSVKKLCPKFCLEEIDEEVCQFLDKENCRKDSISKRCPQFCSEAVCIPKCINGKCTDDNLCACNDGWAGDTCEIAECNPKCINGVCTDEHRCRCNDGWTGPACDIGKCIPRCINGFCNEDNRCMCYDGYSGPACDISCPADYFQIPGGSQCFRRLGREYVSWTEAKSKCAAEGAFLAKPDDPAALASYIMDSPTGGISWSWIGGRGTGSSLLWDRDGTILEMSSPNWFPGHEGKHARSVHCLAFFINPKYPDTPYHFFACKHDSVPLCELPRN